MKKRSLAILWALFFLCLGFGARAASPTFQQFFGSGGIVISTNGNIVVVDGSSLTNGSSGVYITTNIFVSNLYATNIYSSNIVVQEFTVTSNAYFNYVITTNLTINNITTNNGVIMDRVFTLAGGVIRGTNHFWDTNLVGNLDVTTLDLLEGTPYFLTISNPAQYQVTWSGIPPSAWVQHPGDPPSATTNGVSAYLMWVTLGRTNAIDFGWQMALTNGAGIRFTTNGNRLLTISATGGDNLWTNDTAVTRLVDGTQKIQLSTNVISFGGTSSAFPALWREGAGIDVRLADNSGFATFTAGAITAFTGGMNMDTVDSATAFAYTFNFRKKGDTGNTNAAIANGAEIGNTHWRGWDGSAYGIAASIVVKSEQAFSGSSYGGHMEFKLTSSNNIVGGEVMRLVFVNPTNGMLLLNGTSASFPALKRWGAILQHRLADNSGFAGIEASSAFFAGPLFTTNATIGIGGVTYVWPNAQAGAAATLTNDAAGNVGWWPVSAISGSIPSLGMLRSNQFTTNISGSPVIGGLWLQGSTGGAYTNGARVAFEYYPSNSAVRVGSLLAGSGAAGFPFVSTSTYSNYWDPTNVGNFTWVYGSNSLNRGDFSSIAGGARNIIETNATYSFIGGGSQNFISTNALGSFVGGGTNNIIVSGGTHNFIGGGSNNKIQSSGAQSSVIVGGFSNEIGINNAQNNCQYSFIGGGNQNHVYGSQSVIAGGEQNGINSFTTTFPTYSTIGGGTLNFINAASGQAGDGSTIAGGRNNWLGSAANGAADDAVISGGNGNQVDTSTGGGVIAGGMGNYIGSSSPNATISGGKSNQIAATSPGSFILAGISNNVGAANAGVVGYWDTNAVANSVAIGVLTTNHTLFDQYGLKAEGLVRVKAGRSTAYAGVGGSITNATTVVVSAGAAETNLQTFVVLANTLTNAGDRLRIRASGRFAANGDGKQLKLVWGSENLLDTTSQAVNSGAWTIDAEIIRTGNTSQSVNASYNGNGMTLFTTANSKDLVQTNGINTTLKLTSTSATDGNVTNRTLTVDYIPAAPQL